jgi:hypothetical protein
MVRRRKAQHGGEADRDAQWRRNIRHHHRNRQQSQMTMRYQRNDAFVFRKIGVWVERLVCVPVSREGRDEKQQQHGQ